MENEGDTTESVLIQAREAETKGSASTDSTSLGNEFHGREMSKVEAYLRPDFGTPRELGKLLSTDPIMEENVVKGNDPTLGSGFSLEAQCLEKVACEDIGKESGDVLLHNDIHDQANTKERETLLNQGVEIIPVKHVDFGETINGTDNAKDKSFIIHENADLERSHDSSTELQEEVTEMNTQVGSSKVHPYATVLEEECDAVICQSEKGEIKEVEIEKRPEDQVEQVVPGNQHSPLAAQGEESQVARQSEIGGEIKERQVNDVEEIPQADDFAKEVAETDKDDFNRIPNLEEEVGIELEEADNSSLEDKCQNTIVDQTEGVCSEQLGIAEEGAKTTSEGVEAKPESIEKVGSAILNEEDDDSENVLVTQVDKEAGFMVGEASNPSSDVTLQNKLESSETIEEKIQINQEEDEFVNSEESCVQHLTSSPETVMDTVTKEGLHFEDKTNLMAEDSEVVDIKDEKQLQGVPEQQSEESTSVTEEAAAVRDYDEPFNKVSEYVDRAATGEKADLIIQAQPILLVEKTPEEGRATEVDEDDSLLTETDLIDKSTSTEVSIQDKHANELHTAPSLVVEQTAEHEVCSKQDGQVEVAEIIPGTENEHHGQATNSNDFKCVQGNLNEEAAPVGVNFTSIIPEVESLPNINATEEEIISETMMSEESIESEVGDTSLSSQYGYIRNHEQATKELGVTPDKDGKQPNNFTEEKYESHETESTIYEREQEDASVEENNTPRNIISADDSNIEENDMQVKDAPEATQYSNTEEKIAEEDAIQEFIEDDQVKGTSPEKMAEGNPHDAMEANELPEKKVEKLYVASKEVATEHAEVSNCSSIVKDETSTEAEIEDLSRLEAEKNDDGDNKTLTDTEEVSTVPKTTITQDEIREIEKIQMEEVPRESETANDTSQSENSEETVVHKKHTSEEFIEETGTSPEYSANEYSDDRQVQELSKENLEDLPTVNKAVETEQSDLSIDTSNKKYEATADGESEKLAVEEHPDDEYIVWEKRIISEDDNTEVKTMQLEDVSPEPLEENIVSQSVKGSLLDSSEADLAEGYQDNAQEAAENSQEAVDTAHEDLSVSSSIVKHETSGEGEYFDLSRVEEETTDGGGDNENTAAEPAKHENIMEETSTKSENIIYPDDGNEENTLQVKDVPKAPVEENMVSQYSNTEEKSVQEDPTEEFGKTANELPEKRIENFSALSEEVETEHEDLRNRSLIVNDEASEEAENAHLPGLEGEISEKGENKSLTDIEEVSTISENIAAHDDKSKEEIQMEDVPQESLAENIISQSAEIAEGYSDHREAKQLHEEISENLSNVSNEVETEHVEQSIDPSIDKNETAAEGENEKLAVEEDPDNENIGAANSTIFQHDNTELIMTQMEDVSPETTDETIVTQNDTEDDQVQAEETSRQFTESENIKSSSPGSPAVEDHIEDGEETKEFQEETYDNICMESNEEGKEHHKYLLYDSSTCETSPLGEDENLKVQEHPKHESPIEGPSIPGNIVSQGENADDENARSENRSKSVTEDDHVTGTPTTTSVEEIVERNVNDVKVIEEFPEEQMGANGDDENLIEEESLENGKVMGEASPVAENIISQDNENGEKEMHMESTNEQIPDDTNLEPLGGKQAETSTDDGKEAKGFPEEVTTTERKEVKTEDLEQSIDPSIDKNETTTDGENENLAVEGHPGDENIGGAKSTIFQDDDNTELDITQLEDISPEPTEENIVTQKHTNDDQVQTEETSRQFTEDENIHGSSPESPVVEGHIEVGEETKEFHEEANDNLCIESKEEGKQHEDLTYDTSTRETSPGGEDENVKVQEHHKDENPIEGSSIPGDIVSQGENADDGNTTTSFEEIVERNANDVKVIEFPKEMGANGADENLKAEESPENGKILEEASPVAVNIISRDNENEVKEMHIEGTNEQSPDEVNLLDDTPPESLAKEKAETSTDDGLEAIEDTSEQYKEEDKLVDTPSEPFAEKEAETSNHSTTNVKNNEEMIVEQNLQDDNVTEEASLSAGNTINQDDSIDVGKIQKETVPEEAQEDDKENHNAQIEDNNEELTKDEHATGISPGYPIQEILQTTTNDGKEENEYSSEQKCESTEIEKDDEDGADDSSSPANGNAEEDVNKLTADETTSNDASSAITATVFQDEIALNKAEEFVPINLSPNDEGINQKALTGDKTEQATDTGKETNDLVDFDKSENHDEQLHKEEAPDESVEITEEYNVETAQQDLTKQPHTGTSTESLDEDYTSGDNLERKYESNEEDKMNTEYHSVEVEHTTIEADDEDLDLQTSNSEDVTSKGENKELIEEENPEKVQIMKDTSISIGNSIPRDDNMEEKKIEIEDAIHESVEGSTVAEVDDTEEKDKKKDDISQQIQGNHATVTSAEVPIEIGHEIYVTDENEAKENNAEECEKLTLGGTQENNEILTTHKDTNEEMPDSISLKNTEQFLSTDSSKVGERINTEKTVNVINNMGQTDTKNQIEEQNDQIQEEEVKELPAEIMEDQQTVVNDDNVTEGVRKKDLNPPGEEYEESANRESTQGILIATGEKHEEATISLKTEEDSAEPEENICEEPTEEKSESDLPDDKLKYDDTEKGITTEEGSVRSRSVHDGKDGLDLSCEEEGNEKQQTAKATCGQSESINEEVHQNDEDRGMLVESSEIEVIMNQQELELKTKETRSTEVVTINDQPRETANADERITEQYADQLIIPSELTTDSKFSESEEVKTIEEGKQPGKSNTLNNSSMVEDDDTVSHESRKDSFENEQDSSREEESSQQTGTVISEQDASVSTFNRSTQETVEVEKSDSGEDQNQQYEASTYKNDSLLENENLESDGLVKNTEDNNTSAENEETNEKVSTHPFDSTINDATEERQGCDEVTQTDGGETTLEVQYTTTSGEENENKLTDSFIMIGQVPIEHEGEAKEKKNQETAENQSDANYSQHHEIKTVISTESAQNEEQKVAELKSITETAPSFVVETINECHLSKERGQISDNPNTREAELPKERTKEENMESDFLVEKHENEIAAADEETNDKSSTHPSDSTKEDTVEESLRNDEVAPVEETSSNREEDCTVNREASENQVTENLVRTDQVPVEPENVDNMKSIQETSDNQIDDNDLQCDEILESATLVAKHEHETTVVNEETKEILSEHPADSTKEVATKEKSRCEVTPAEETETNLDVECSMNREVNENQVAEDLIMTNQVPMEPEKEAEVLSVQEAAENHNYANELWPNEINSVISSETVHNGNEPATDSNNIHDIESSDKKETPYDNSEASIVAETFEQFGVSDETGQSAETNTIGEPQLPQRNKEENLELANLVAKLEHETTIVNEETNGKLTKNSASSTEEDITTERLRNKVAPTDDIETSSKVATEPEDEEKSKSIQEVSEQQKDGTDLQQDEVKIVTISESVQNENEIENANFDKITDTTNLDKIETPYNQTEASVAANTLEECVLLGERGESPKGITSGEHQLPERITGELVEEEIAEERILKQTQGEEEIKCLMTSSSEKAEQTKDNFDIIGNEEGDRTDLKDIQTTASHLPFTCNIEGSDGVKVEIPAEADGIMAESLIWVNDEEMVSDVVDREAAFESLSRTNFQDVEEAGNEISQSKEAEEQLQEPHVLSQLDTVEEKNKALVEVTGQTATDLPNVRKEQHWQPLSELGMHEQKHKGPLLTQDRAEESMERVQLLQEKNTDNSVLAEKGLQEEAPIELIEQILDDEKAQAKDDEKAQATDNKEDRDTSIPVQINIAASKTADGKSEKTGKEITDVDVHHNDSLEQFHEPHDELNKSEETTNINEIHVAEISDIAADEGIKQNKLIVDEAPCDQIGKGHEMIAKSNQEEEDKGDTKKHQVAGEYTEKGQGHIDNVLLQTEENSTATLQVEKQKGEDNWQVLSVEDDIVTMDVSASQWPEGKEENVKDMPTNETTIPSNEWHQVSAAEMSQMEGYPTKEEVGIEETGKNDCKQVEVIRRSKPVENEEEVGDLSMEDPGATTEASKDINVKATHKKSHNILSGVGSKVKHSISKVKKAITGKPSQPKNTSPKKETAKGE